MNSTTSITTHSLLFPDVDKMSCGDLGDEHIYFNLNKIYLGADSFTFESVMHVKCGKGFELKVEQTLKETYHFRNNSLTNEVLKEIIEKLYSDSLQALEDHAESAKKNALRNVPAITITKAVLDNYYASLNYKDLYQSCFREVY